MSSEISKVKNDAQEKQQIIQSELKEINCIHKNFKDHQDQVKDAIASKKETFMNKKYGLDYKFKEFNLGNKNGKK